LHHYSYRSIFSVKATGKPHLIHKAGNVLLYSLITTRTIGLNDVYGTNIKNSVKDIYTIVIEDSKEELDIAIFLCFNSRVSRRI
jgi:hypothetical protein